MSQTQNAVSTKNNAVLDDLDDDLSFLDDLSEIIEEEEEMFFAETPEGVLEIDPDFDEETELLTTAVKQVEVEEEMVEIYADQGAGIEINHVIAVEGNASDAEIEATLAEIEPEAPAAKRVSAKSGKTSERIESKLGNDFIDKTTLSVTWASKSEQQHREDFAAIADKMALYVADKAVNLFTFLKTGGGLNGVTLRAFQVLIKDDQITSGESGNLMRNLLSKPYSHGTSASQTNQIFQLFTDLEICVRQSKGVMIANPDSIILEEVKKLIGK